MEFQSPARKYWDWYVMILAIYNCVWTPLTISFRWAELQTETNVYLKVFD